MGDSQSDALLGQVVEGRYRIEGMLGAGGMGAVYRARHVKVGREVAIKVLHDHLVQDAAMVERFEREAALAAKLSHKNLIAVIDVGETPAKQKLMVLELAHGRCMADIIGDGPLAPVRVVGLLVQLLAGLEHAHAAGLVHRDLKPENIIVALDDYDIEVPKIVDFGIAMLRDDRRSRLTAIGQVLGTPQYMAPEHAQGRDVDPRSDLFALGVIAYEMLAGKLPFDAQGVDAAIANMTKDPPALAARAQVVVEPLLEAFVRRLMARRAADRFASARAALDVLELLDTHPAAARELLAAPRSALVRIPRASAPPTAPTLPMTVPLGSAEVVPFATRMGLATTVEAPRAAVLGLTKQPKAARSVRTRRARGPDGRLAPAVIATMAAAVIAVVITGLATRQVAPAPGVVHALVMTPPPPHIGEHAVTHDTAR